MAVKWTAARDLPETPIEVRVMAGSWSCLAKSTHKEILLDINQPACRLLRDEETEVEK